MLNERKLTKPELAKREDIVMDMKKNKRKLVKRYGKDAEKVMYGRATNMAKKQNENMDDKKLNLRKMIEDALQNPKAADLNKDGKLSDYEEKRGAAIEKNLKEENIGLADLEEMGYEEGEKAAYTYGTLVTKLQNRPDKLAYNKGFIQGVKDELGSYLSEDLTEDLDLGHQDNEPHMLKADLYRIGKYAMELYQILDQFEGGSEEVDLPHWWQSKIIKSKDAIVGAKHYLDFEIKEPQIDAMVDVAQDVEAIDEFDDKSMKAYGDAVKKAYGSTPQAMFTDYSNKELAAYLKNNPTDKKAASELHKRSQKLKDLSRTDVKEGVWSLGSAKSIKNIIGILDMALDIKDPQELMDLMDMHDKSMYNIVGDDVFHDDIDGAKRELAQNNLDRAYNRLIDAKGRAEDLLKIASENDLKNPSIFEGIAKKLAQHLKSK